MPAQSSYEYHQIRDPDFPIIFHQETLNYEESGVLAHWHENIELLWFVDGRGAVVIDSVRVEAGPGELVMIDSNRLHRIFALSAACCYYCLIVDKAFCERFGIPVGEARLKTSADSGRLRGLYGAIASEMAQKQPHYKAAVLAGVLALLAELYRNYMDRAPGLFPNREQTNRSRMVRGAISFLRRSYQQPLTIDDICREVGFSKFYFCRVFHEEMCIRDRGCSLSIRSVIRLPSARLWVQISVPGVRTDSAVSIPSSARRPRDIPEYGGPKTCSITGPSS